MDENELKFLFHSLSPQPLEVRGQLLAVHLGGRFVLVTDDGNELSGSASEQFPLKELGQYLGQEVTIRGVGFYTPTRQLTFIFAEGFSPINFPAPKPSRLRLQSLSERKDFAVRLKGLLGKWPGAQSDEEEKLAAGKN